jgi:hypothetical protein
MDLKGDETGSEQFLQLSLLIKYQCFCCAEGLTEGTLRGTSDDWFKTLG